MTLLDQIVEDVAGPVVLVAHSAGVLVTVHWAAQYSPTRVVGALLVTPAAFAVPLPPGYPSIEQLRAHGWLPVPRRPLPFPSILAVSTDDPLGNAVRLRALARPLGLSDLQFGIWAGASIHEVGQVVAAAGAGGAAVVAIAVVVKLTRVLLLAPVVATVSVRKRLAGQETAGKRLPIVPLFVLGFLACVALRSTGVIPTGALPAISQVQVAVLGAALFGMGAAVQIRLLFRGSGRVLLVATLSTLLVTGVALAGVLFLG